jgi:hypothetical protein
MGKKIRLSVTNDYTFLVSLGIFVTEWQIIVKGKDRQPFTVYVQSHRSLWGMKTVKANLFEQLCDCRAPFVE